MEYFSFKSKDFFNDFENFSVFYASSKEKPFFFAALPFSKESQESCAYLQARLLEFINKNEEKLITMDFFQLKKALVDFTNLLDQELNYISTMQNCQYAASLTMIVFALGSFFCIQIGNCPCLLIKDGILRELTQPKTDLNLLGSGKVQAIVQNYFFEGSFQLLLFSEKAVKRENKEKLLYALSQPLEKMPDMLSDLFKIQAFGLYLSYQEKIDD